MENNSNIHLLQFIIFLKFGKRIEYWNWLSSTSEKKGEDRNIFILGKNEITIKYLHKGIYKNFSKDIDFEIYFKKNIKLQRDSKFKDFIILIEGEKYE
jgi:hypothetical protein